MIDRLKNHIFDRSRTKNTELKPSTLRQEVVKTALLASVLGTAMAIAAGFGVSASLANQTEVPPITSSDCFRTFEDQSPSSSIEDRIEPEKYEKYLAFGYKPDGNGGLFHHDRENGITAREVNYFTNKPQAVPVIRSGALCDIPLGASIEDTARQQYITAAQ